MDEADLAYESSDFHLQLTVASARRLSSTSKGTRCCIDCGKKIPEKRRRAAQGCKRCIKCQIDYEKGTRP